VPTILSLHRARTHVDARGACPVTLLVTGGLRVTSDFAKALALGADAVAIGTAAMIACGCQPYRVCHTGRRPVGVATKNPERRAQLDIDESAAQRANFLHATQEKLTHFARVTRPRDLHAARHRSLHGEPRGGALHGHPARLGACRTFRAACRLGCSAIAGMTHL